MILTVVYLRHSFSDFKERPYACPQDDCSSRFGQKSDLNKHFKTVHQKIKPYACPECGLTFGHRGNLLRHVGVVRTFEVRLLTFILNGCFGYVTNMLSSSIPACSSPQTAKRKSTHAKFATHPLVRGAIKSSTRVLFTAQISNCLLTC